jgi:cyclic pyranopterin phosphate synthase
MLVDMEGQGISSRLPQFRVTVNSRCGRACFFCRPSGEGVATVPDAELRVDDLVRVACVIRSRGITGVKLTGGDPALYAPLGEAVSRLRGEAGFTEIEVISRHPEIGRRAPMLAAAGVTRFNVSLDTLDAGLHREITGRDDHALVLDALQAVVATGVPVKVNMVVMAGVNDGEIADLARWCDLAGVRALKLLDVIKDLDQGAESFARRLARKRGTRVGDLFVPLDAITARLAGAAVGTATVMQGGLGHPMTVLTMPGGFRVIVKDSRAGAWYGDICGGCRLFPCHDALMALRLTADRRLQFCLLREEITVELADALAGRQDLGAIVDRVLLTYAGASFRTVPAPAVAVR